MFYSDDPAADASRFDAHCHAEESKLPKCSCCGEPIQTEKCYNLGDGLCCPDCLEKEYEVWTEDYID